MCRIWIEDDDDRTKATELLDNAGIKNDLDGGDRIIYSSDDADEVHQILEDAEIDYDEI